MFAGVWKRCKSAYNSTKRAAITAKNVSVNVVSDAASTARDFGIQFMIMYRAYSNSQVRRISDEPWYESM